jgi:type IV pilus assembly protein PilV
VRTLKHHASGRSARIAGASLVEVLVALLIVTLGMLGVASLMIQALRNGHLALLRTQAVTLASDIADRIRANPQAGDAYHCARYPGGPSERNCAAQAGVAGANCTAYELAEDDLARWGAAVADALPLAGDGPCRANVSYLASATANDAARYRVTLAWHQRGDAEPASYETDVFLMPFNAWH